jgi:hypothetical protein
MTTLQFRLRRMMRWHAWGAWPAVALLALICANWWLASLARYDPEEARRWQQSVGPLLWVGTAVALSALICWGAILLWHIFRTGQAAFGASSGVVYVLIAVALAFWPGLFVVPHMIRLDVKRLCGVDPDTPEDDSGVPALPAQESCREEIPRGSSTGIKPAPADGVFLPPAGSASSGHGRQP